MYFTTRKPTRIARFDCSQPNCYFITICAHNHRCIFGLPGQLNELGRIVDRHIQNIPKHYQGVSIDKYVVMPNHVHMILVLESSDNPGIPQIIGQFKTGVTKEIRRINPGVSVWQRSFHDHIIRNQTGYEKIWNYIEEKPQCWNKDCFYTEFI